MRMRRESRRRGARRGVRGEGEGVRGERAREESRHVASR